MGIGDRSGALDGRGLPGLVLALVLCFCAPAIGGLLTRGSVPGWYEEIAKPSWTPPGWLFGPVWTLLYIMMAVAAWLVWLKGGWSGARPALILFGVQLVLNAAWTPIFFGLHKPGLAFAEIVVLWAAIGATLVAFWGVNPVAGLLLVPYWLWVSFASCLNFAIWRLNA
jgi:tryptophan-rich sensory protein